QLLPPVVVAVVWGISLLLPIFWRALGWRWLAALTGGLVWAFLHVSLHTSALLSPVLEGKDLILTGRVIGLPLHQAKLTRFEMQVEDLEPRVKGVAIPRKVRLSWYDAEQRLRPGEAWRLQVRLKRPRGFQNPGGFDYERWLFGRGIQATGYVKNRPDNQRLDRTIDSGWLDRQRQAISAELARRVADADAAALLRALAIGDRTGLSDATWQTFTRTGTNHLVAISGLHIGMVAGLVFFLGQWLWRRSERLTLALPARRAAAWLALGAGIGYAALAGFSLPTQRALMMLALGLGALLMGRSLALGRSLSLALFGVLLFDPLAPLSNSFWLSFGAVAVILFAMGGRLRQWSLWWRWGRVQWVVAFGLAPLLLMLFNQASLVAPLVNLILVPWFSLVLVPLVLLSVLTLSLPLPQDILLQTTATLAEQTLTWLQWGGQSPLALVYRPDLPLWVWLMGLFGVGLLLLPRGLPGRPLGLLMIAPILFNSPPRPETGGALFSLLDVGQGLSCVVETAGHVLVYDTGPAYASGFNTAQAVLLPYLRSRGISRIDRLVVSNADRDHAGGVSVLVHEIPIDAVLTGEALGSIPSERCDAGFTWRWDGVTFRVLHPESEDRFGNANDASCVLQVETSASKLLIPGDVEHKAEQLLVDRYGQGLHSDILVAPHHGSNTSSSRAFVAHTRPNFVLFPTGYRNRFGFPKRAVVQRWQNAGATLLNSAETGAIQFWLGPGRRQLQPLLYREDHPQLWLSSNVSPSVQSMLHHE
ncbi:MAG: DNA internalization-related competence protein ComEC/Rec2, partial [Chromatiales bacterium]